MLIFMKERYSSIKKLLFSPVGNLEKKTLQKLGAGFIGLNMILTPIYAFAQKQEVSSSNSPAQIVEKKELPFVSRELGPEYRAIACALTYRKKVRGVLISTGIDKEGKDSAQAKVKGEKGYEWIVCKERTSAPNPTVFFTVDCGLGDKYLVTETGEYEIEDFINKLPRKKK